MDSSDTAQVSVTQECLTGDLRSLGTQLLPMDLHPALTSSTCCITLHHVFPVFALLRSRSLVHVLVGDRSKGRSKVGDRVESIMDAGRSRIRMGDGRSLELRVVSPPSYNVAGMLVGTTSFSSSSGKTFCLCLTAGGNGSGQDLCTARKPSLSVSNPSFLCTYHTLSA